MAAHFEPVVNANCRLIAPPPTRRTAIGWYPKVASYDMLGKLLLREAALQQILEDASLGDSGSEVTDPESDSDLNDVSSLSSSIDSSNNEGDDDIDGSGPNPACPGAKNYS